MQATERALMAATALLTTDHHLVQALTALRRGRLTFRPEPEDSLRNVEAHLEGVARTAQHAETMCQLADLTELARLCGRIDSEITAALRAGPYGADIRDSLRLLTSNARELLAAADTVPL